MTEEFLKDTNETSAPEVSGASSVHRDFVKVLIIGSPQGVNSTIRTLYSRGFAEVTAWSPLQPTANSGEVMSVLGRYILIQ